MTPPPTPAPRPAVPPTFRSFRELRLRGASRRGIDGAVAEGRLLRVRRGRYVPVDTPGDFVAAAETGGRLDCLSLLRHLGVFVLDGAALHIQVTPGASRLPPCPPGVVRHWRSTDASARDLATPIIEALAQACRCQSPRAAVATLDSAWHAGLVDEEGIAAVFARLPHAYRVLRPLLDRRSESGPETLLRLLLRGLGCSVDVQADIDGVGRVDFVIDGWLIIECDSEAYHSGWASQKRDRRRDVAAAARGYTTLRPIAEDIMHHPEVVLAGVRGLLAAWESGRPVHNSSTIRAARPTRRRSGR